MFQKKKIKSDRATKFSRWFSQEKYHCDFKRALRKRSPPQHPQTLFSVLRGCLKPSGGEDTQQSLSSYLAD